MQGMIVGVVGAGRLGRALVARLSPRHRVLVADQDRGRAAELESHGAVRAVGVAELFAEADVVLLVVPPGDVVEVVREHGHRLPAGTRVVNMATSVPTKAVADAVANARVEVVGAKMVGQALALSLGLDVLFVCNGASPRSERILDAVLSELGRVVPGDDGIVGLVNDIATRFGLALSVQLREKLDEHGIAPEIREAAVKSVAVGTILEFPPEGPNPYIESRLEEIGGASGRRQFDLRVSHGRPVSCP